MSFQRIAALDGMADEVLRAQLLAVGDDSCVGGAERSVRHLPRLVPVETIGGHVGGEVRIMPRSHLRTLALAAVAAAAVAGSRALVARRRLLDAVEPQLRHPLLLLPVSAGFPGFLRLVRRVPVRPAPLVPGVEVTPRLVPARGDHPAVEVLVYEPPLRARPSGVLLWTHGGGFVFGDPAAYHDVCSRFAAELGIVVVSVDYRLAPEHPFPAGLEDCYTVLAWIHEHAADLGVDRGRIAVGGDSAGGGLSATLAQLAHDRGVVPVCFQLLVYPMLDDRTVLRADHAGTGAFVWSPSSNRFGWTAYLGHEPRTDEPRPYAAAARRDDVRGLPRPGSASATSICSMRRTSCTRSACAPRESRASSSSSPRCTTAPTASSTARSSP